MSIFQDDYVKHYIKLFISGLGVFALIAIALYFIFQPKYEIKLKQNEFTYGESVNIASYVSSIGGTTIKSENIISSNTIKTDNYEVSLDNVDITKLGEQTINAVFSDSSIEAQKIKIYIVDNEKPKIKFVYDEPYEMELKELKACVKSDEFNSFFTVNDNETDADDIKVNTYIKEAKYKKGDKVHLIVVATDKSENISKKSFVIKIKKEEKVEKQTTEEKTDSSTESNSTDSSNTSSNQQTNTNTNSSQQTYQQSQTQQSTQTVTEPKPSNRTFLFSDGYDMSTAPSACSAALNASSYSGSCVPLQDSDGIYYGMQLIFD